MCCWYRVVVAVPCHQTAGTEELQHQEYQASQDGFLLIFDCGDTETGVAAYQLLIGTAPGAGDLYDEPLSGTDGLQAQEIYRQQMLAHNDEFYVTVVACNALGLCSNATGNATRVDATPPHIRWLPAPLELRPLDGDEEVLCVGKGPRLPRVLVRLHPESCGLW